MSYEKLIKQIFDYCVDLLEVSAQHTGMSYEEINVWFFIVFEPLLFASLAFYAIHQRQQIHKLKSRSKPVENKAHNTDRSHFSYLTGSRSS